MFNNNEIVFSDNIMERFENEECKIMKISNNTGEGIMTVYPVFNGIFLVFHNFHMQECESNIYTKGKIICIDHCREGKIETELENSTYTYLSEGELRLDNGVHNNGKSSFPLGHYYGVTIVIEIEKAKEEIKNTIKDFSVDIKNIYEKYCSNNMPYVISSVPEIYHIFSELYNVPLKIRKDYFKIKVLELLLFLDAIELDTNKKEQIYFYKDQVEKIKSIHKLLTTNLDKNYTIEYLSKMFSLSETSLKKCFSNIYGKPIYSYIKAYKLNYAASLLKTDKKLKISEISEKVGYESPSKFAKAFKKKMGRTPLNYRKYSIEAEDLENEK